MHWAKALLAAGTAVVILAGCSENPSEPTSAADAAIGRPSLATASLTRAADDAELDQLAQRVAALKAAVVAAGRVTLNHQLELDRLATAVTAWRSRTGRGDINVSSPQALQRQQPTGDTGSGCSACPIISSDSPGKICFLKAIGPCAPIGNELWPVCYYLCFDIATGIPDLKRR